MSNIKQRRKSRIKRKKQKREGRTAQKELIKERKREREGDRLEDTKRPTRCSNENLIPPQLILA